MNIKNGVNKIKKDHRDRSFPRTFGSVAPPSFSECNFDIGLTMPDQEADGLPYGCTGYTQPELAQDEDKRIYIPRFTYDKTLAIEGIFPASPQFEKVGCDVRDSLKSCIVYGLQAMGETPATALNYRRGAYYAVEQTQGMDWFDSLRSALQLNQRSISLATPWYSTFAVPTNGIIKAPVSYDTSFASWHNWKCCGWKMINGVPYLISKSWQGINYGDKGYVYFSREIINQMLIVGGTGAFTVVPYTDNLIVPVKISLLETLISYLRMYLKLL